MCAVRLARGRMEMRIRVLSVASPMQAQAASLEYESALAPPVPGAMWQPDMNFSYVQPVTRFDGLVVKRGAYGQFFQTPYGPAPQRYLFETLATRGNVFIGSSVTNHDSSMQTMQMEAQCGAGVQLPACPQLFADRREWAQMVLAVHMTTFPIG
jgi:hypothetical protein